MTTYIGEILAPGAGGYVVIALKPGEAGTNVTGHMKIGSMPKQAITGFSGLYEGGATFTATGENTRGQGINTMYLVVAVRGTLDADRQHASGTIEATLNGAKQPVWTFSAATEGAEPLATARTATGDFVVLEEEEEPGLLDRIPLAAGLVAGAVTVAGGVAYYLKRRK